MEMLKSLINLTNWAMLSKRIFISFLYSMNMTSSSPWKVIYATNNVAKDKITNDDDDDYERENTLI